MASYHIEGNAVGAIFWDLEGDSKRDDWDLHSGLHTDRQKNLTFVSVIGSVFLHLFLCFLAAQAQPLLVLLSKRNSSSFVQLSTSDGDALIG